MSKLFKGCPKSLFLARKVNFGNAFQARYTDETDGSSKLIKNVKTL